MKSTNSAGTESAITNLGIVNCPNTIWIQAINTAEVKDAASEDLIRASQELRSGSPNE